MKSKFNKVDNDKDMDKRVQMLIVRCILFIFVFINVAVFVVPNISENKLAYHLVGIVDTVIGIIVGYYWGSSKSVQYMEPKKKDDDEGDSECV